MSGGGAKTSFSFGPAGCSSGFALGTAFASVDGIERVRAVARDLDGSVVGMDDALCLSIVRNDAPRLFDDFSGESGITVFGCTIRTVRVSCDK